MRQRLVVKLLCAGIWLIGAAGGCSWFTSDKDAPSQQAAGESKVSVPDGTPEELDTTMRKAVAEVNRFVQASRNSAGIDRDEKLAEQLATGIQASEKLAAHPKATAEQVEEARKAKLALLYIASRANASRFENQFGEYVDQLVKQAPEEPIAAIGRAAWIEVKHVGANESPETVLPLLSEYAKTYPDRQEGIQLFETYADSLARHGKRDAALRCCRLGIEYYKDHTLVGRLRLKLSEIERGV